MVMNNLLLAGSRIYLVIEAISGFGNGMVMKVNPCPSLWQTPVVTTKDFKVSSNIMLTPAEVYSEVRELANKHNTVYLYYEFENLQPYVFDINDQGFRRIGSVLARGFVYNLTNR